MSNVYRNVGGHPHAWRSEIVKPGKTIEVADEVAAMWGPRQGPLVREDLAEASAPEPVAEPAEDPRTVAELKDELRAKGLKVSGTKDELLARLASEEE